MNVHRFSKNDPAQRWVVGFNSVAELLESTEIACAGHQAFDRFVAVRPNKLVQLTGAVVLKEVVEMSAPAGAFARLRCAGDHTRVARS